jgi:hypothetical protein
MNIDGHISVREWRWVLIWAAVILAVTCVPYLVAWVASPPGYQFSGILVNPLHPSSTCFISDWDIWAD